MEESTEGLGIARLPLPWEFITEIIHLTRNQ
jgi:hypothetical protein